MIGAAVLLSASLSVVQGSLAREIVRNIESNAAFSGAVLVESHGDVVLQAGFGLADRERLVPFTSTTVAPIGSITKQFTASAILLLRQRGLIDLNHTLGSYLPQTAEPARSLRLRDLMNHTSGLAEYCPGGDFRRVSTHDLLATCAALPLAFPKGTWHYSNLGFSFLGAVVEAVSKTSLQSFLERSFFARYGMTRTGSRYTDWELQHWPFSKAYDQHQSYDNEAVGIARLKGQDWNLKANGDVQSTAADMLRWYHALTRAPELAYVRNGLSHPTARNTIGTYYANGWFVRMDEKMRPSNIFHSGSDGTMLAYFGWWPKKDRFLYYVTNFGSERSVGTLKRILAVLSSG